MNTLFAILTAAYMNPSPDAVICTQRGVSWTPETRAVLAEKYCPPNTEKFSTLSRALAHREDILGATGPQYKQQWVRLYIETVKNEP